MGTIRAQDRLLELLLGKDFRRSGFRAYRIYSEAATKYFFEMIDGKVEFIQDKSDPVNSRTIFMNGNKIPAQRIK